MTFSFFHFPLRAFIVINQSAKSVGKTKHQNKLTMIKNMSIILSEHFNLTEFTTSLVASTRRIDNTPPLSAVSNLQQLCLHVLEPLRAHLGHAVRINSGYRSPKLNAAVGGVKTSDPSSG